MLLRTGARWVLAISIAIVALAAGEAGAQSGAFDETGPNGGESSQASIEGQVLDPDGTGREGVAIDLFSEGRETYLESVSTGPDGRYRFTVDPGCYVLTLVAPEGFGFSGAPLRVVVPFRAKQACVSANDNLDLGTDTLISIAPDPGPFIRATVTDQAGGAVAGIQVDLFASNTDGERLDFLSSLETDSDGTATFNPNAAGCYVATFVATGSDTFSQSGTRWLNRLACGQPTESRLVTASLVSPGSTGPAEIAGMVTDQGEPEADLTIDLFAATGDGGRGAFLGDSVTDSAGEYSFTVEPGCYILTFIAPDGRKFEATGTPWSNRPVCVAAGERAFPIVAALS